MNSEKLKAYLHLSRPTNLLITFVSIPVACWISGGSMTHGISILLAALTGVLVTAGANAINDAFDIEIDRINRPDRPLPRGILTRRNAEKMWLTVSGASILMSLFINLIAFLIVSFSVVLLYYYSARLKRTILVGNLVVGLMTGMAFIYGGVAVGRVERAVVPAIFAFLVNLARELIKDVEDIEGDRKEHVVTLPIRFGIKSALSVSTLALLLLIAATLIISWCGIYKSLFIPVVLVADFLLLGSVVLMWGDSSSGQMKRVSTVLKASMVVGLISIIVGSV